MWMGWDGTGIGMRRLTSSSSFAARTIQLRATLSQKIMNSPPGDCRVETEMETGEGSGVEWMWRAAPHPASGSGRVTYAAPPETAVSVFVCAH